MTKAKKKTPARHQKSDRKPAHEEMPDEVEESMSEEEVEESSGAVEVDVTQSFFSDEYGVWVNAGKRYSLRADLAQRWLDEGKALPVMKGIETPETGAEHETATIKLAETK